MATTWTGTPESRRIGSCEALRSWKRTPNPLALGVLVEHGRHSRRRSQRRVVGADRGEDQRRLPQFALALDCSEPLFSWPDYAAASSSCGRRIWPSAKIAAFASSRSLWSLMLSTVRTRSAMSFCSLLGEVPLLLLYTSLAEAAARISPLIFAGSGSQAEHRATVPHAATQEKLPGFILKGWGASPNKGGAS